MELNTARYAPGTNPKAETIARRAAVGYRLSFNRRGDWLVRRRNSKTFIGVIVNVNSHGAPSPIASRSGDPIEFEHLRGQITDALIRAGILESA